MTTPDERRAAGMAKMQEVYGFSVDPDAMPGDHTAMMVDTSTAGASLVISERPTGLRQSSPVVWSR